MRALVVEDDRAISGIICEAIHPLLETEQAFDGEEGLYLAEQNIYDIIILDIMMPYLNGYQVLKSLREQGISTPVLLLTAKDGIDDKIQGFKQGADDYLIKPFYQEELMARLEAILRRSGGGLKESTLSFHHITLNLKNRLVSMGGETFELPGKQFDILEYLITNKNTIVTRDQIFYRIWGMDSETSVTVVEVYASNLRKVLKKYGYDHYLRTVRGLGYMLTDLGGGDE